MPSVPITGRTDESHDRDPARWLLAAAIVFAVALGLRFGHLASLRAGFEGSDLFDRPRIDAAYHWQEALDILDRDIWLKDRVPFKGPGYSYFLAALMALVGRSLARVKWVLAILGALNCGALVILARRFLRLRVAVAAGLLAAANGLLIVYDGEPYFPTLLISLNLPVLFFLGGANAGWKSHAAAGFLLGLACLVHPAYLFPTALLAVASVRKGLRSAAALVLAVSAAIAPLTLKNVLVQGQPVLVSWSGGVNLYAANSPTFDPYAGNATQAWDRIMMTPLDAGIVSGHDRDRLYRRLAARQALRHPVESALGLIRKVAIFFSPVEYASNFRIYDLREYSWVAAALLGRFGPVWVPWGVCAPAALIGLAIALRRNDPLAFVFAVWSLGVLVSVVLTFNTARYRAPVAFFASLWAALTISAVADAWRRRAWRGLAWIGAVYLALASAMAAAAVPQTSLPPSYELDRAVDLPQDAPFEELDLRARAAVDKDPRAPATLFAVAGLYATRGRHDLERAHLVRVLSLPDLEPDLIDLVREKLAGSYFAERRFEEARSELRAALAVHADDTTWRGYPYYPMGLGPMRSCWLRLELAEIELGAGEPEAAGKLMRDVAADCPSSERFREILHALGTRAPAAPK